MVLAAASYAGMGFFVKLVGDRLPDEEMVFMRSGICLVTLLPWLFFPHRVSLKTNTFISHLIRAVAGFLNMYCFFLAIGFILLADAMVLNNTMPLFIPILLWLWKREKISIYLAPGLLLGFMGIIFIINPTAQTFQIASLLALASGLFMAVSMVQVHELAQKEPIVRILFYYFLISTFLSAVPLFWTWKTPTTDLWILLVSIGVSASLYQYLLVLSYRLAPAWKVSPLIYFAVIFSGLIDWLQWGNVPTFLSYTGMLLVVIGGISCMWVKEKKK